MPKEQNAYILGTEQDELFRLGLQHEVWSEETHKAWRSAGFRYGQNFLDLGSGPGYCSVELAYISGSAGRVTAIDKSEYFIDFLKKTVALGGLNIQARHSDFETMELEENFYDGVFSRWALAWVNNPDSIIRRVMNSMKPGGMLIAQEYYDWQTLQTEPSGPNLKKAIAAAYRSLKDQEGDIDIGRRLPDIFQKCGLELVSLRPMAKIVRPGDMAWYWPRTFFENYFPRLAEKGIIDMTTVMKALKEYDELGNLTHATVFCPQMVEVIARKPIY